MKQIYRTNMLDKNPLCKTFILSVDFVNRADMAWFELVIMRLLGVWTLLF